MIKCYSYDIVCQEIPDEVTLALNISGCPLHCKGCHSPWLWKNEGVELSEEFLSLLVQKYSRDVTCMCFMGGDQAPWQINALAKWLKANSNLKTGWYSGGKEISKEIELVNFNYIKTGPYIQELGGLRSAVTNQRLYKVHPDGSLERIKFSPKNG